MKSQITFFKNHCESKFKMLEVEKRKNWVGKKSYRVKRNVNQNL